jgi:hypothetical protein
MAQPIHLRERAGRCRRLARDSTDATLRGNFLELADEYATRAAALESAEANSKRRLGRSGRRSDWLAAFDAGGVINRRK